MFTCKTKSSVTLMLKNSVLFPHKLRIKDENMSEASSSPPLVKHSDTGKGNKIGHLEDRSFQIVRVGPLHASHDVLSSISVYQDHFQDNQHHCRG